MRARLITLLSTIPLLAVLSASALAARPAPPAAAPATAPAAALVAGTDYVLIEGGKPYAPKAGKIEVVEVFGYTCVHCARFESQLSAWKRRQPADVAFTPVAAPFGGAWQPFAQGFYAARALGLAERAHAGVFNAVHLDGSLPRNASSDEIAAFYAKFGADPARFAATMAGAPVQAELKRANDFLVASGVDATPSLVVNGKYRVLGQSFQQMLQIADQLVARERAATRRR